MSKLENYSVEVDIQTTKTVRTLFTYNNRTYSFVIANGVDQGFLDKVKNWFESYLKKGTLPKYFYALSSRNGWVMFQTDSKHISKIPGSFITQAMRRIALGYEQKL